MRKETCINQTAVRNAVLVVFSLIFYAWGEPMYVLLMIFSVFINFLVGIGIDKQDKHRKLALIIGLVFNLLILGTFKYAGFIAESLNFIGIPVPVPHIALPIGISFYTFQSISYLIDVYRKQADSQKRFVDLLLYISMFPQLIAGPIVRYDLIAKEINNRRITRSDVVEGSYRFLIGLGKKVILANQFSEIANQFLQSGLPQLTTMGAWVGIAAFTLQIFFDFSGYSDMAIGLGRCLGFHFAENFKHPYRCISITDFWRKWHISLGSFFRDYVYIPMGGNRTHQVLNILVVWFLTGMWHGASWNFILWGVYFGIIVTLEKYTLLKVIDRIPKLFLHIYSLLLVIIGWGIFYFTNLTQMQTFFRSFFGQTDKVMDFAAQTAIYNNFWLWVAGILFSMPVYDFISTQFAKIKSQSVRNNVALITRITISLCLLFLSIALLVGATNNAFIYTRF
ncbi:MBOAT family O-acyltransferase [Prevotella aurantiaca]|nr:MBOAT family O-acyltransferase [Prevotella aurantiaca]